MPTFQMPIDFGMMGGHRITISSGLEYYADFNWRWMQGGFTGLTVEPDIPPQAKTNRFMVNNKRRIPSTKVFKQF